MTAGGYGFGYEQSSRARERWQSLSEAMGRAHEDVSSASAGGLPGDVAAAARAFLAAWGDLTQQSRQIAVDFAESLVVVDRRYSQADDEVRDRFDSLDGRLGSGS